MAAKQKKLVIVESPAKAGTIGKFLGRGYKVLASQGHVRDLPRSQLGVDVEDDFAMRYITIRGKGEILAMLRKEAKSASDILLATDPDREGEAISWHLAEVSRLTMMHCAGWRLTRLPKNPWRRPSKNRAPLIWI